MPNPQGPQCDRTTAQVSACGGPAGAAPSLGARGRRQGRAAATQSRAPPRPGGAWCCHQHSRRARRDVDRQSSEAAGKAASFARLHQLDREHDGDGASRLSQCEAMAKSAMALRWTAAGMMEAAKGFRRLKAYRLLPILRAALVAHATEHVATKEIEPQTDAA